MRVSLILWGRHCNVNIQARLALEDDIRGHKPDGGKTIHSMQFMRNRRFR